MDEPQWMKIKCKCGEQLILDKNKLTISYVHKCKFELGREIIKQLHAKENKLYQELKSRYKTEVNIYTLRQWMYRKTQQRSTKSIDMFIKRVGTRCILS